MHKFVWPVLLPGDPIQPLEAATKQYVDTHGGGGLGTITSDVNLGQYSLIVDDGISTGELDAGVTSPFGQGVALTSTDNLHLSAANNFRAFASNMIIGTTSTSARLSFDNNTGAVALTGNSLTVGGLRINDVGLPSLASDAATKQYVDDQISGAGPKKTIYAHQWNWTTKTTDANSLGQIGTNSGAWTSTFIQINEQVADSTSVASFIATVTTGDTIKIQVKTDATRFANYTVTGAPTDQGTWWRIPVSTGLVGGAVPTNDMPVSVIFDVISPAQIRNTTSLTTVSLANSLQANGVVQLAKGYRLSGIATSVPARVRLYTTIAKRDADATRTLGTYPTKGSDHGLQFEYVTVAGTLSAELSPTVDGFDGSTTPVGLIPYIITNLSGITNVITVTFTWIKTE